MPRVQDSRRSESAGRCAFAGSRWLPPPEPYEDLTEEDIFNLAYAAWRGAENLSPRLAALYRLFASDGEQLQRLEQLFLSDPVFGIREMVLDTFKDEIRRTEDDEDIVEVFANEDLDASEQELIHSIRKAAQALFAPQRVRALPEVNQPRPTIGVRRSYKRRPRTRRRRSRSSARAGPSDDGDESDEPPPLAPASGGSPAPQAEAPQHLGLPKRLQQAGSRPPSHPVLELFPPLTREQIRNLNESIRAQGLLEPITRFRGELVDGRGRWEGCAATGVKPVFDEWQGDPSKLPAWILAKNLARRHLSNSQRTACAALAVPLFQNAARARQLAGTFLPTGRKGTAASQAAEAFSVRERSVARARMVQREDPALFEQARLGAITFAAAETQLKFRSAQLAVERFGGGLPDGRFDVIVVDPPWPYAGLPYPTMSLDDIRAQPIPAADNCVLFLWTTHKFLGDAVHVLEAWNFGYQQYIVWEKRVPRADGSLGGQKYGRTGKVTELALVATRGAPAISRHLLDHLPAPARDHSRKPEEFYACINKLYPSARKLEMFARQPRTGWKLWGADLDALPRAS